MFSKLLDVTGGKERIRYFVEKFSDRFQRPADYEGFVKRLQLRKTSMPPPRYAMGISRYARYQATILMRTRQV